MAPDITVDFRARFDAELAAAGLCPSARPCAPRCRRRRTSHGGERLLGLRSGPPRRQRGAGRGQGHLGGGHRGLSRPHRASRWRPARLYHGDGRRGPGASARGGRRAIRWTAPRAAPRRARRAQGSHRGGGRAHDRWLGDAGRSRAGARRLRHRAAPGRRRGDTRQARHARVRLRPARSGRTLSHRAQSLGHPPRVRRILLGLGRGRGRRTLRPCAGWSATSRPTGS